jgi:hypothetical protein
VMFFAQVLRARKREGQTKGVEEKRTAAEEGQAWKSRPE